MGKIKHFQSLAVLHGNNGLMWLAGLACLLLEHIVDTSFTIQLLAAMISLPNYYCYYGKLFWIFSSLM